MAPATETPATILMAQAEEQVPKAATRKTIAQEEETLEVLPTTTILMAQPEEEVPKVATIAQEEATLEVLPTTTILMAQPE